MTVPSLWQPPALPIAGHLLHREEGMISRSTLQIGRGDRDHACRRESDESHDGGTWPEGDTLLCHTRSLDANGVRITRGGEGRSLGVFILKFLLPNLP